MVEKHGAGLRAGLKQDPGVYYCMLLLGVDPKNWTDDPNQFEHEMNTLVPAAMRTTARRNEAAKVWGMSEGQKYDY